MRTLLRSAILVVLLSGVGCQPPPGGDAPEEGEAVRLSALRGKQLADVPVPRDFKLVEAESIVVETQGARIAQLSYLGATLPGDVIAFYRNLMPVNGWALDPSCAPAALELVFRKKKEECTVAARREKKQTRVAVKVRPANLSGR